MGMITILIHKQSIWLDFHADGDAKAPFYRVSEGVFVFQLTRPVGNLVILMYEDEQIEVICIVKEKPIMHLGIGPAQASRSETSAYAEPLPEIANDEYKSPLDYTSALDTEENINTTTEKPQVPPVVVIKVDEDADVMMDYDVIQLIQMNHFSTKK